MPFTVSGPVQPTHELAEAKKNLLSFGYCVLPGALQKAQVLALRERVEEQMEAERKRGLGYTYGDQTADDGGKPSAVSDGEQYPRTNRWISMLINKGQPFVDLLEHSVANRLMDEFLGEGYLLSSYAVHITRPGVPAKPVCHTDQWFAPRPYPRNRPHHPAGNVCRGEFGSDQGEVDKLISPPIVANILWLLNDFEADSGGTRLVPGSHLSGEEPDPAISDPPGAITVTGPAGTAVMFDGRIWHGAGTNHGKVPRIGLFTTYCAGMFRPLENYVLGTAPEVLAKASPHLLERLGFKPWQAYGRIGENVADFISFERDYVGELRD